MGDLVQALCPLARYSSSERVSILSRVYVWSIALEPLLFFVLFERNVSGITSNLSRIIQFVVTFALFIKFVLILVGIQSTNLRLPHVASRLYANYFIYLIVVLFAGLGGALVGAYNLPFNIAHEYGENEFSRWLNSQSIRHLFEYIIAVYYFVYFAVFPVYLLNTRKHLDYLFSVFKTLFFACVIIGFIDFGFSYFEIYLLPRHIADWRMVGLRFHGIAGEPRDAFVYLFLGLAILHLEAFYKGKDFDKRWWVIVLVAAMLTESASGLLGIICFLGLYGIYYLNELNFLKLLWFFAVILLVLLLLYIIAVNSSRIVLYLRSASNLWNLLEQGKKIPYPISVQMVNIYPLYDLIVKLRNWDIVPVLIGSGLGSASVINNTYERLTSDVNNPNSSLVRLIFESGIVGTYFFIESFISPVKYLIRNIPKSKQNEFVFLTLLLLGCVFAHRSASSFIYLGIFIAVFSILKQSSNSVAKS